MATVPVTGPIEQALAQGGLHIPPAAEAPERILPRLLAELLAAPVTPAETALPRLRTEPGWVPLLIYGDRVVWASYTTDLSRAAFFYEAALEHLAELSPDRRFTTHTAVLTDSLILPDEPPPSGMIFHMSRCGSTLLARALHAVPGCQVLFEGPPGSLGLIGLLTDGWTRHGNWTAAHLTAIRNAVALCTRRGDHPTLRTFIKMISWNAVFYDLYRAAFPETPAVFLYRDPLEVFPSMLKRPPECWPLQGTPAGDLVTPHPAAERLDHYRDILAAILHRAVDQTHLHLLHYRQIRPENLAVLLKQGLDLELNAAQLAAAQTVFGAHAKYDHLKGPFEDDAVSKRAMIPPWFADHLNQALAPPYQALSGSSRNVTGSSA